MRCLLNLLRGLEDYADMSAEAEDLLAFLVVQMLTNRK
jgi:hypothetical protein